MLTICSAGGLEGVLELDLVWIGVSDWTLRQPLAAGGDGFEAVDDDGLMTGWMRRGASSRNRCVGLVGLAVLDVRDHGQAHGSRRSDLQLTIV